MGEEFTVTVKESEEFPGHFSLNDAAMYTGMHASYLRTLVRAEKIAAEDVKRDERKRIFIAIVALEELKARRAQREENAALRAAGELPKYKAKYVPASLASLQRVRKMVVESDFDDDTKSNVDAVLESLWEAKFAEIEAKKAAEAEAEAVEEAIGPEEVE